jgi:hypothetical protein
MTISLNRNEIVELILEHAANQGCDSEAYVASLNSMDIDELKTELARLEEIAVYGGVFYRF